jgi:hypothetical protein
LYRKSGGSKVQIRCLFGQRRGTYEGQYAPELLAAIDEWGDEDNPDYLNDAESKAREQERGGEFSLVKRIIVTVDDEAFDRAFSPEIPKVAGEIEVDEAEQSNDMRAARSLDGYDD